MSLRSPLWKSAAALAGLACLVALSLAAFAPQIFLLLPEGFPAPVWPAKGQFVQVAGAPQIPHIPGHTPPDPAQARFDQAQGRALLMLRNGQLIYETYGANGAADQKLNSYSMVKSLIGVLVIKAHSDGLLPSLDMALPDILGPDAPDTTVRAALRMQSGLTLGGEPPKHEKQDTLDDAAFSPFSAVGRLHAFGIQHILPSITTDPNAVGQFHYQSANTALLGMVLEQVYQQPLSDILSQKIWKPAGAQSAQWRRPAYADRVSAYCCLYARPLDWIKVGAYLLHNGSVEQPFLRRDLWRAWILPDLPPHARRAGQYGWHIRHDVLDRPGAPVSGPFAYMMGHGGQMLYLLPQQNAVVLRFGANPQLLHSTLYELFAEN